MFAFEGGGQCDGAGGWGHRVGDNVADTPPEASGAEASPLDEMLVPEVLLYVFLSFLFDISLLFPKR